MQSPSGLDSCYKSRYIIRSTQWKNLTIIISKQDLVHSCMQIGSNLSWICILKQICRRVPVTTLIKNCPSNFCPIQMIIHKPIIGQHPSLKQTVSHSNLIIHLWWLKHHQLFHPFIWFVHQCLVPTSFLYIASASMGVESAIQGGSTA